MQSQEIKIGLAILITVIVVGGGAYFLWGNKGPEIVNLEKNNSAFTQSSKEYAVMGSELWNAFACSSWASITGDTREQEKLFLFGYNQGQKFLSALRAEKIKQEDLSQEVPIGVTMLLQGPSDEFILGGIYRAAQDEALKEVFNTDNKFNSDEMQKLIAGNKFRDGNCQLIGQ